MKKTDTEKFRQNHSIFSSAKGQDVEMKEKVDRKSHSSYTFSLTMKTRKPFVETITEVRWKTYNDEKWFHIVNYHFYFTKIFFFSVSIPLKLYDI